MIPGHEKPLDATHCELCFSYWNDPRYRQLIDSQIGAGQAAAGGGQQMTSFAHRKCVHEGADVPAAKIAQLGLSPIRRWLYCLVGHGHRGVVCKCEMCGVMCPSYVVDRNCLVE